MRADHRASDGTAQRVRKSMIGKLAAVFGIVAVGYLAIVGLVYVLQSRMVYFPAQKIEATPARIGLDYEDVWLHTGDGVRIHGWYLPAPGARRTVLFLHGNAGNVSHRLPTLALLRGIGMSTLIIDYRGYGLSEGRPSEAGTYEDALAAWRYLTRDGTGADSIVLFGRSLGGAVAAWLASRVEPAGLVLESTFTSAQDLARHHYPLLPVRYLLKFRYDSLALAKDIRSPALISHSRDDEIVPFDLGLKLYRELRGRKAFIELSGGHNDRHYLQHAAYQQSLRDFFASL